MPGLNVLDSDGQRQEFADANTWHIDDRGQLHLNADSRPVASFARECWQAVAAADLLAEQQVFDLDALVGAINGLQAQVADAARRGARDGRSGR